MQAAVQHHVDSAISNTVNVREDMPFEAFQDVYWDAYRSGCKGCTTYRPNPVTGAVLEAKPAEATSVPAATASPRRTSSSARRSSPAPPTSCSGRAAPPGAGR
jgi:ribonucleoside-diphosphate reductase alpha chain